MGCRMENGCAFSSSAISWFGAGVRSSCSACRKLVRDWKLDFVAANGENAAGGFGITEAVYQELVDVGVDVITGGNHSGDQKEALVFIERAPKLIRPINFPSGTPGRGASAPGCKKRSARAGHQCDGPRLHGSRSTIPSRRSTRELTACPLRRGADAIVVDIHAEATSRENGDGPFLRRPRQPGGRHPQHAPTADHHILATAPPSLRCGLRRDDDSIIGMDKDEPLTRFVRKIPVRARARARRSNPVRACGRNRRRNRAGAASGCGSLGRRARGGQANSGIDLFQRRAAGST